MLDIDLSNLMVFEHVIREDVNEACPCTNAKITRNEMISQRLQQS